MSRAAIPVMREGGGGSIVNLASLTAQQPIDGIALSNALRPALVGMAKTLSREAAPELRVNNIATEHILTDRIRDIAEHIWRQGDESVDDTLWQSR
jgi:3-oxoacyl-[acyl-carrier protein] reductase